MAYTREERAPIRRLLWSWANTTAYCARRQHEIANYIDLMDGVADIKRSVTDGLPTKPDYTRPSRTETAAERLEELRERYRERIDDLTAEIGSRLELAAAMDDAMAVLTEQERVVIDYRYKREKHYEEIARKLTYSKAQVENIERTAVEKLISEINIRVY